MSTAEASCRHAKDQVGNISHVQGKPLMCAGLQECSFKGRERGLGLAFVES
jgi:hypothetical protein